MAQFGRLLFVSRPYTNICLKLSNGSQHLNLLFTTRCLSNSTPKFDQKEISEHVSPDAGAVSTSQKGILMVTGYSNVSTPTESSAGGVLLYVSNSFALNQGLTLTLPYTFQNFLNLQLLILISPTLLLVLFTDVHVHRHVYRQYIHACCSNLLILITLNLPFIC